MKRRCYEEIKRKAQETGNDPKQTIKAFISTYYKA